MKALLSKIKNLGSYARKTAFSTAVGVGVFLGALGVSNEAKAIIENDTIFAQTKLKTRNIETNSPIPYVDLKVWAIAMETIIPDTTYNITTSNASTYTFSQDNTPPNGLPIFIDIHESTNEIMKNPTKIMTTPNGDANVFFKEHTSGIVEKYSITGALIGRQEFSGNSAFMPSQHEANGAYVLRVMTDDGIQTSHKFMKVKNSPSNPLSRPAFNQDNNNLKNTLEEFATYRVSWDHPGFVPDSIDIEVGEEYAIHNINMTAIAALAQDWKFTVFNLDGEPLENALVYINPQGTSVIDSTRTDASGNAYFDNLAQGSTYNLGFGGLIGYKAWESRNQHDLEWSVPNDLTVNDTVFERGVVLKPDQVIVNGEVTNQVANDDHQIFSKYNIMLSLYGHMNQFYRTTGEDGFSGPEMELLMGWQEEFTAMTGIPIVNKSTPFDLVSAMQDFNPYTVDENSIGTNVESGNNLTIDEAYYDMPNFNNERTIVAARYISLSCSNRAGMFKEILRTNGYNEGGGAGAMAGTPQDMTNQEAGQFGVNYNMGIKRFGTGQHNFEPITKMTYLKDNLEFGNSKSANANVKMKSNSNSIFFVSPKYESK